MVALQAMATYLTDAPPIKKSELDIDLYVPSKQYTYQWTIRPKNIYVAKSRTVCLYSPEDLHMYSHLFINS